MLFHCKYLQWGDTMNREYTIDFRDLRESGDSGWKTRSHTCSMWTHVPRWTQRPQRDKPVGGRSRRRGKIKQGRKEAREGKIKKGQGKKKPTNLRKEYDIRAMLCHRMYSKWFLMVCGFLKILMYYVFYSYLLAIKLVILFCFSGSEIRFPCLNASL